MRKITLLAALLLLMLPALTFGALSQQDKLTASDGAEGDEFGYSVSLSDDALTAIVGAHRANTATGAAYVYRWDGTGWLEQKLTAGGSFSDFYGASVSLSGDGDTAVVGAWRVGPTGNDAGAAYFYSWNGTNWVEQARFFGGTNHRLGYSTALSEDGNTAIVGATGATVGITPVGAARIYARSGTTWSLQQILTASDGAANNQFGVSVDLSDDGSYAIVGASNAAVGGAIGAGAAYIFSWNGTNYAQEAKLFSWPTSGSNQNDYFGASVALSGDASTAIVGATGDDHVNSGSIDDEGSAYIFRKEGTAWSFPQYQRLYASDASGNKRFGRSVDFSGNGDIALVGTETAYAAYLFEWDGAAWAETQKLSVASEFGKFGLAAALSDDGSVALVGAPTSDAPGAGVGNDQGAAYVFAAPAAAGPDITVNNTVAFGDVTQTTISNRTVTVRNDGTTDLIIGQIAQVNPLAAPFSIPIDGCSNQTITSGFDCTLTVRFSPTSVGSFSDSFDIPSNDTDENPVTVNVSGTGTPGAPEITVGETAGTANDDDVPFGEVTVGSDGFEQITVTNDGNDDLGIGIITLLGGAPFYVSNDYCTATTLTPSTSCTFDLQFSPTSEGAVADTLRIPSNDADENPYDLAVGGTGAAAPVPNIEVDNLILDYPDLTAGNSTVKSLTIGNSGDTDLTIGTIDSVAAPFTITVDNCSGMTLSPLDTCLVSVQFAPTSEGAFADTITIPSNDPDGAVEVAVGGNGLAPPNNPPSAFDLIFPANGQVDVTVPVDFRWEATTDPDGDAVIYDLYVCTESDFTGCSTPVNSEPITASLAVKGTMYAGTGLSLMVFGFILTGDGRRRWIAAAVILIVLLSATFFAACGWHPYYPKDKDSGANEVVFTVDSGDLDPGTLYYWKVVATDDGSPSESTESAVWSFTTE